MSCISRRAALLRSDVLRYFGATCFALSLFVAWNAPVRADERSSDWFALPSLVDPSVLNVEDTNPAPPPSINFRRVSLSEVLSIDVKTSLNAAPSEEVVAPIAELHQVRIIEEDPAQAARSIPRNNFRSTLKNQTPEPADFQGVRTTPVSDLPIDPGVSARVGDIPPFTPETDGLTLRDHLNQMMVITPAPATLLLLFAGAIAIRPLRRFVQHR